MVTGANSGIGFHTARALAEHGAEVVLACRNVDAGREAAEKISGPATVVEELDLASQTSVHAFADRFDGPLDLLVNNAGVMTPPKYRETDGRLRAPVRHQPPRPLRAHRPAAAGTCCSRRRPAWSPVASVAHHRGDESVLEGNPESSYSPTKDYGNTKLANLLFAFELHRRAEAAGEAGGDRRAPRCLGHQPGRLTRRDGRQPGRPQDGAVRLPIIFQSSAAGARPVAVGGDLRRARRYVGPQRMQEARGPLGEAKPQQVRAQRGARPPALGPLRGMTGVSFDLEAR